MQLENTFLVCYMTCLLLFPLASYVGFPIGDNGFQYASFEDFLMDMAAATTWGDHVTLQAAANMLGQRILAYSNFPDHFLFKFEPLSLTPGSATLRLAFRVEVRPGGWWCWGMDWLVFQGGKWETLM